MYLEGILIELVGFFAVVVGVLTDPIALIGYVLAGASAKKLYIALCAGMAWAIAVHLIVAANVIFPGPELSESVRVLLARIVGSVIAVLIVWLIARQIRRLAVPK